MSTKKAFVILGGLIFGTAILGSILRDDTTSAVTERKIAGRGTLTTIQISARDIYEAYDENEINANDRFHGRSVRVLGTIESIAVDRNGVPYVQLEGRGIGSVRANFTTNTVGMASLRKGSEVAVTCIGVGLSVTVVHLKDCRLD